MHTTSLTSLGPTSGERISAAIAHGGALVAWFIAPLVVYFFERDRSSFASRQALQALVWSGFGTVLSAATCGLASLTSARNVSRARAPRRVA